MPTFLVPLDQRELRRLLSHIEYLHWTQRDERCRTAFRNATIDYARMRARKFHVTGFKIQCNNKTLFSESFSNAEK